jgi:RHS repeat-associated protein
VSKVVDPAGNVSTREFNDFYEEVRETDALGNVTQSAYDQRGNLIESSYPDGTKLTFAYDGSDSLIEAQDAGGGVWKYEYDAWRRMVTCVDPVGARTEYVYDRTRLIEVREATGQSTGLSYDGQGNVTQLRRSSGWQMEWRYDGWGRDVAVRDVNGNVHALAIDLLGRLTRLQEPDGKLHDYGYDPEGNLLFESSVGHQVTYTYAGQRALASRTEDGTTVRFEYDTEMQLIAVFNEHGAVYRYVHGATGEVVQEIGYDGLMRAFKHDALNRIVEIQVPNVSTSTYVYDALGRPTQIAYSDGEKETFDYTPMGELRSASNSVTRVTYERDLLGQVLRETQGAHWIESDYDLQGERIALRSSLGADQKIERDAQGESKSVSERQSYKVDFKRDVLGYELERHMPGGVRSQWTRDSLGRPLQHQVSSQLRATRAVAYEWDPNGRLRKTIDAFRGNSQFGHDGRDRLSWAQLYDRTQVLRMPDAVGNLFRSQLRNDRLYGPAGQLLESHGASGVTKYSYDVLGNLVEKVQPGGRRWRYTWSAAGHLATVERPDGSVVRFEYDALGRRVRKIYRGQTTTWIWDDDVPLHEWVTGDLEPLVAASSPPPRPPADAIARRRDAELEALLARGPPARGSLESPITWLFVPDALIPMARLCGDEQLSIVTDHVGTPVAAHDANGDVVWSATILPDGGLHDLDGEPYTIPFRFEGQYEDAETGLYYNRFRYYDPEAGVYVGRDPIGILGGTALYAYVGDPLTETDPFGLHKNMHLAGSNHPVTGVPFTRSGYPKFDSVHDAKLPDNLLKASDRRQFKDCNRQLREAVEKNPALKKQFTPACTDQEG